MTQATFRSGSPIVADYTPGSAVTAGDVIVLNDRTYVARADIAASALGALDCGGGVYQCTGDAAITAGKKVYWDNANDKVTETAMGNKVFGYVAPGSSCSGDGATVDVVHDPSA